jgi:hypothetical protein
MKTIDFSKSFITWRVDTLVKPPKTVSHKPPFSLNNARVQADCHCEITVKNQGESHVFVLGASCKTERVGVERDIWLDPNADFVPVLSKDHFLAFKTFDRADKGVMFYPPSLGAQPERQVTSASEAFAATRIDVVEVDGELLKTPEQINEAVLSNQRLVAQTEIENDRYTAMLTYPVKTINANERDQIYQTDTGPVLFPDLSLEPRALRDGLELAFSAFNCETWTEFIVRTKTPITGHINVYHYSKSVRLDCQNRIIRLLS